MASPVRKTTMMSMLVAAAAVASMATATSTTTTTTTTTASASSKPKTYTIAGVYETKSTFALTASRIDLDQTEIENLLLLDSADSNYYNGNDKNYDNDNSFLSRARRVYEHGMHSGPYAELQLKPRARITNNDNAATATATATATANDEYQSPQASSYEYANDLNFDTTKRSIYVFNAIGGNNGYQKAIHGTTTTVDPTLAQKLLLLLNDSDDGSTGTAKKTKSLVVNYPEGSTCNVDGNLDDCFAGPDGGLILQGYGAIDYTYDPRTDNRFAASLKGYSVEEGERMFYCETHNKNKNGCSNYPEYQHFYNYYGVLDYGHHWITAALDNTSTVYTSGTSTSTSTSTTSTSTKLGHGNQDFSVLAASNTARNAAVATATVAMNVFTRVNRLMVETGIDGCTKNAGDFSGFGESSKIAAESVILGGWDAAVATYAGSALIRETVDNEEEGDVNGNGNVDSDDKHEHEYGSLYFNTVRTLANQFGVLERSEEHPQHPQQNYRYRSVVNRKILDEFETGRDALRKGDCKGAATDSYRNIVHLMRVPWIQGVLKSAFLLSESINDSSDSDSDSDSDSIDIDDDALQQERGNGAAYAAALLPDLHFCSPGAAEIVYNEFKLVRSSTNTNTNTKPNYRVVREALEHQYQCLGVTCDDVGGYLRTNDKGGARKGSTYYEQTRPCGGYGTKIPQRRESVTYDSVDAAVGRNNNNNNNKHFKQQQQQQHRERNFVSAAFLVGVAAFCVSLKVLHATVREHAGRADRTQLAAIPGQLLSAVSSRADYWMSGGGGGGWNATNTSSASSGTATREVQLQSMVAAPPHLRAHPPSWQGSPVDSLL